MSDIPPIGSGWLLAGLRAVRSAWEVSGVQIDDPAVTGPRNGQARWVLTIVIATTALTGLSMSIMVVTFPAIRADFPDATPAQPSGINTLSTIVSAAVLIPAGVLADRAGRKRMVLI